MVALHKGQVVLLSNHSFKHCVWKIWFLLHGRPVTWSFSSKSHWQMTHLLSSVLGWALKLNWARLLITLMALTRCAACCWRATSYLHWFSCPSKARKPNARHMMKQTQQVMRQHLTIIHMASKKIMSMPMKIRFVPSTQWVVMQNTTITYTYQKSIKRKKQTSSNRACVTFTTLNRVVPTRQQVMAGRMATL